MSLSRLSYSVASYICPKLPGIDAVKFYSNANKENEPQKDLLTNSVLTQLAEKDRKWHNLLKKIASNNLFNWNTFLSTRGWLSDTAVSSKVVPQKKKKEYATIPSGIMGRKSLALVDWG